MEEELLAQMTAAPDDPAAFLVYADLLQQRGDPRGRLIAVQLARAAADAPALEAEEAALLAAHPALRIPAVDVEPPPSVEWRHGFWHALAVGSYGWSAKPPTADSVATLLAAPSARLLRELAVRADLRSGADIAAVIAQRADTLEVLDLTLARESLDDTTLRELAACTKLRSLALFSCEHVTSAGLAALAQMTGLERLDLRNCKLDDAGATWLAGLPLRNVWFNAIGAVTPEGMRILAAAPLEKLDLYGQGLGDDHLRALADHATLADLTLSPELDLRRPGMVALASMAKLRRLVLHSAQLDPVAATWLSQSHALRILDLGHCKDIHDDALAAIATLPELRALDIGATSVTRDGVRALRGTPLQALDLSFLELGDSCAELLASLPQLEQLALGWTGAGDAVVDALLQLPKLEYLDLSATPITADGVARLTAHPALEMLGLYDCSDAARARAAEHARWYTSGRDALELDFDRYK
jgi:uncharacterized protein (TIGR02996 family)